MSIITIEGHIAYFVAKGQVDIGRLVPSPVIDTISAVLPAARGPLLLKPIKDLLDESITYSQIKFVAAHLGYGDASK
jgi:hypothetical protein